MLNFRGVINKTIQFSQFISSDIPDRSWNGSASQVRKNVKDVVRVKQLGLDVSRNSHESNFYKICKYRFLVIPNFLCCWRYCMFQVFFRWFTVDNMIISIWEIFFPMITLPKTNSSALKMDGRKMKFHDSFPFGAPAYFQGRTVSFREGIYITHGSLRVVKATMWRPRNHLWMGRIEVGNIICDTYPSPNH